MFLLQDILDDTSREMLCIPKADIILGICLPDFFHILKARVDDGPGKRRGDFGDITHANI